MASFGFHLWISSLIIIVLGSLNNDPRSEPAGARTTMACSADRLSDWLMASLHQVSQLLYRLRGSAHAKFLEKGVSTHLGRRPHNGPGRLLPQDVDHFVDRPATWPKSMVHSPATRPKNSTTVSSRAKNSSDRRWLNAAGIVRTIVWPVAQFMVHRPPSLPDEQLSSSDRRWLNDAGKVRPPRKDAQVAVAAPAVRARRGVAGACRVPSLTTPP